MKEDFAQELLRGGVEYQPMNEAVDETWKYVVPIGIGIGKIFNRGLSAFNEIKPYLGDIWAGRNLIFSKNPSNMNKEEFLHFNKMGNDYYKNYLQKNPAYIKDYGQIPFTSKNRGKDITENFKEYPFLRMQLSKSKMGFPTNTKNEPDRYYDHFFNDRNGKNFDYIIEVINGKGARYKMMKNIDNK